jgi:peroxiredoxin
MTHSSLSHRILVCLVVLPLMSAASALGAEEKAAAGIEPKAEKVVRAMAEYMRGLKSFRVDVAVSMRMTAPGMKQEVVSAYVLAVRRPDRLAMLLKNSVIGTTIVSDGKKLYTYTPMEGKYRVTDAPKDLGAVIPAGSMIGPPAFASPTFAGELLHALLVADPYAALMEDVKAARYLGTEDVSGVPCDHLEFSTDDSTWYMWVQTGGKPLIRKVAPDIPQQIARLAKGMPGIRNELKLEAAIMFDNWAPDVTLPDEQFKFTPPEGVTLTEAPPSQAGSEAASSLLGKPAPPVKLDLLDGGKLDLAQYKGKDIVILDFWATWCGPCAISMPILIDIANEYRSKGVLFFAIDLEEPPERVRDFLKEKKWAMPVALDKTGAVAEAYGAQGIPHTVIIGKDGTVQVVHEGFDPDMKATLKRDLDALLAGKTLAPKK